MQAKAHNGDGAGGVAYTTGQGERSEWRDTQVRFTVDGAGGAAQ